MVQGKINNLSWMRPIRMNFSQGGDNFFTVMRQVNLKDKAGNRLGKMDTGTYQD